MTPKILIYSKETNRDPNFEERLYYAEKMILMIVYIIEEGLYQKIILIIINQNSHIIQK